jgi:hypothetical protein
MGQLRDRMAHESASALAADVQRYLDAALP